MTKSLIHCVNALLMILLCRDRAASAEEYAVFRSEDDGRSWTRADSGLPGDARINAFGSLDDVIFAGTDAGIFLSRDEAQSWHPTDRRGGATGRILCFAAMGQRIWAGTDGHGILMSLNKGGSWVEDRAFPRAKVRCLLAHDGRFFAGTDAEGVWVFGDQDQVWRRLSHGLPALGQVFALAMVEDQLFAGLYGNGLYVLNPTTEHWGKIDTVVPLALAGLRGTLVAGHNPGGISWSDDRGISWFKAGPKRTLEISVTSAVEAGELSAEAPVWELASSDDLVLAGASSGIYYSEDRGRTWARARGGIPEESPGIAFLVRDGLVLAGAQVKAN